MSLKSRFVALVAVLALLLTPVAALAQGVEYAPAPPIHPTHPLAGPTSSLPEKAEAYGVYCRGFSKKHVHGVKGTLFSRCVTAMAKVESSKGTTAKAACAGFPKSHLVGQKGTLFSRCVVAAAQVKSAKP